MQCDAIDGYLLDGIPSKGEAIAAALAARFPSEATAPFYRALEAVGERAADEALIALRLVLAGKPPGDDAVRRLRALAALARGGRPQAIFESARATLSDLDALRNSPEALALAARAAYHATFHATF